MHFSCVMFHIILYHLVSFFMPVYSKDVDTGDNYIYCGYHGFLGPDPLFNKPDARAGPLPDPPHEAAQGVTLY